ncbi:MAG: hypothetical protein J5803_02750, partial [Desulfovibrio sp.]|nr:hypothetical protein [Desulfovibrio sp.]
MRYEARGCVIVSRGRRCASCRKKEHWQRTAALWTCACTAQTGKGGPRHVDETRFHPACRYGP